MKFKKSKSFCHFTPSPLPRKGGFTLIELAIILVVIGLLVGLGVGLVGILTKQAKLRESREIVKQAREAFLGYAVKMGYLLEEGTYDPTNPVQAFQTVGVKGIDLWGKPLRYIVADELEETSPGSPPNIDVCGINTTNLEISDRGTRRSNIAFLIISGGENYNIQTENNIYEPDTSDIDDFPTDINRPENYDDIVAYASLDEIRSLRGCPQPLAVISPSTLPQGEEDSFYSYQLQAIGGKPPYTWNEPPGSGLSDSGLSLDASGLISGTLNVNTSSNTGELTACSADINVNATVTDSAGSPPQNYTGTIRVRPKPLTIITQTLPSAYEESPYSATISASGGRTPYLWSISVSPSCPSGLTCSDNSISGTPAPCTAGTYTVTSTVNDTCTTNTKLFVLTINPSGNCLNSGIAITNNTGANRFYRISTDSGTTWSGCNTWPDGGSINITPDQTVRFFRISQRCDSQQLSCQHTYCTLKGFDTDSDCLIQLSNIANNSCTIGDQ